MGHISTAANGNKVKMGKTANAEIKGKSDHFFDFVVVFAGNTHGQTGAETVSGDDVLDALDAAVPHTGNAAKAIVFFGIGKIERNFHIA